MKSASANGWKNIFRNASSASALVAAVCTFAFVSWQPVLGASMFADAARNTCTTPNCQAAILDRAVILSGEGGSTVPFTAQFWSSGNECVRVEVLSTEPAGRDLIMHLIGPDLFGAWRDDDSGAGLLPRIEANTYSPGHYMVAVGYFIVGSATTNTRFRLSYGRYPLGNPNCAEATVPLETSIMAAPESEK